MHAITKNFGLEDAIRLSILAGVDIMTFSNNISGSDQRTVDKVHSIIRGMVKNGVIPESRIDESFDRIMKAKKRMMSANQIDLLKQELKALQISLKEAIETVREVNQDLEEKPATPGDAPDNKRSRKKSRE
jgi:beta-N-acetylhexosaminidase